MAITKDGRRDGICRNIRFLFPRQPRLEAESGHNLILNTENSELTSEASVSPIYRLHSPTLLLTIPVGPSRDPPHKILCLGFYLPTACVPNSFPPPWLIPKSIFAGVEEGYAFSRLAELGSHGDAVCKAARGNGRYSTMARNPM